MSLPKDILWQNTSQDVTLLDIPTSISLAQLAPASSSSLQKTFKAAPPRELPFEACEPKSEAAQARVEERNLSSVHHKETVDYVGSCLKQIHSSYQGSWCRERNPTDKTGDGPDFALLDSYLDLLEFSPDFENTIDVSSPTEDAIDDIIDVFARPCTNESDKESSLTLRINATSQGGKIGQHTFRIPPRSSFFLCKLQMIPFTQLADFIASGSQKPFDFIVLDPPWPNASAKRSSSYSQSESLNNLQKTLGSIPMSSLLCSGGIVAIWLTNKGSVRDVVLSNKGLFQRWGVTLFEEWTWIKLTSRGQPISPMDGVWRKPYEVVLLGKIGIPKPSEVRKRVIAAVPADHSQKPCLKSLIKPLLRPEYRGLEIFARNLIAGWTSWGDEVLKYNWEGCWEQNF